MAIKNPTRINWWGSEQILNITRENIEETRYEKSAGQWNNQRSRGAHGKSWGRRQRAILNKREFKRFGEAKFTIPKKRACTKDGGGDDLFNWFLHFGVPSYL